MMVSIDSRDTFAGMVQQLMLLGFSRETAEASVRLQYPELAPRLVAIEKDESILEKEEQAEISKVFRAFGFFVRSTSQPRASKIAPGIPDLWVTHIEFPVAFWWESKRQVGGELSPAQLTFRDDCRRCKIGWGSGDRYDAAKYLVEIGLAVDIGAGVIEPIRRTA